MLTKTAVSHHRTIHIHTCVFVIVSWFRCCYASSYPKKHTSLTHLFLLLLNPRSSGSLLSNLNVEVGSWICIFDYLNKWINNKTFSQSFAKPGSPDICAKLMWSLHSDRRLYNANAEAQYLTLTRWVKHTSQKVNIAELWCVFWYTPERTVDRTVKLLVIWDAMIIMWRHSNGQNTGGYRHVSLWRGLVYHDITYGTYALMGELWGIYCEERTGRVITAPHCMLFVVYSHNVSF